MPHPGPANDGDAMLATTPPYPRRRCNLDSPRGQVGSAQADPRQTDKTNEPLHPAIESWSRIKAP